ncbi:MAG: class II aldolase/adducin family protein [Alphaproteobacteria bacterium]|nr:class II aldolase/adducin family protein [Pseudomonadota bacterium]TDI65367.1 MAG: class II aldolase/adducin family protein [Alphaproteobacteria bacterium]
MCAAPVEITRSNEPDGLVTEEERETRVNLAALYRLTAHYGMDDKTSTHISARVPGTDDQFLLNPQGRLFHQMKASDLIKINMAGEILSDTPHTVIRAGYVIHSAVLGARPDVDCVIHTHTTAGMAVSALKCGLLPVNQKSMKYVASMAYHDYEGFATDLDERERLVADLGTENWLILRNHGLLVCGPSMWTAFSWMHSLESACRVQVAAMNTGSELTLPSQEVIDHAADQANRPRDHLTPPAEWQSHLDMLDAQDPSFRD